MDHTLLEKYFQGRCNAGEQAEVENWLRQEENLPDTASTSADTSVGQEWELIRRRIRKSQRTIRLKKSLYAAASICLIAAIGGYWLYPYTAQPHPVAVTWKTMEIPNGKNAQLSLSDGSTIHLNGGTAIAYPDPFESSREVKLLKGEAFFDIASDPAHPFMVYTAGNSAVKVLGTRFNVKNNAYLNHLEISLNSGKISFSQKQTVVYLNPGEKLNYDLNTGAIGAPMAVDTLKTAVWRQGILVFRDTPMQQVFSELEQHFGITFITDKKIGNQLFTAELNHASLPAILQLMALSSDLKFKTAGDIIHVY